MKKGWLIPWSPWKELEDIKDSFDRLARRFFGEEEGFVSVKSPKIDLWEDENKVVVEAELPGVNKKDVKLSINENTLTIKAVSKKEEEKKGKNYYYAERSYGEFVRTIDLPAGVDYKKAEAEFKNGVLEITIPKTKEAKEKSIKIDIK